MNNFDRVIAYSAVIIALCLIGGVFYVLSTWPTEPELPDCVCNLAAAPAPVAEAIPEEPRVVETERIVRVPATVLARTTRGVNVRSGPSSDAASIGTLDGGTTVEILAVDGAWWRVSTGDLAGWTYSQYLTLISVEGAPP